MGERERGREGERERERGYLQAQVLVALCQKVTRHKQVVEMKQNATHDSELVLVQRHAHLAPVTRCDGGVRCKGGGGGVRCKGGGGGGLRARVKVFDT